MKKVFLKGLLAVAAAVAMVMPAEASLKATELVKVPRLRIAYDNSRNEDLTYATVSTSGEDAVITIFDDELAVSKTFTLKGAMTSGDAASKEVHSLYVRGVDTEDMLATRNVFTKDDKWCVVVSETDNNGIRYCLYNEDGVNLGQLPLGDRYEDGGLGSLAFGRVLGGGGEMYYVTRTSSDKDYAYTFWTFTGDTSAPAAVAEQNQLRAYPNPLPAGNDLTIELDRSADAETYVSFTDMNGRQVGRRAIEAGATTVRVESGMLRRGMIVYTVVYGDGEVASGKVCAE